MRVLKSYGTDGGVIVSAAAFPEDFEITEPVFIDFDELPVPFFIEELKAHGSKKAYLKLEDVDSLEDAEELVGREIYFSIDEDDDFAGFEGLEVFDAATSKAVGTVTKYSCPARTKQSWSPAMTTLSTRSTKKRDESI